jgi:hypothetical protein
MKRRYERSREKTSLTTQAMKPAPKIKSRNGRQAILFAQALASNARELAILRDKTPETLRVVALVKKVFPGAKVIR